MNHFNVLLLEETAYRLVNHNTVKQEKLNIYLFIYNIRIYNLKKNIKGIIKHNMGLSKI